MRFPTYREWRRVFHWQYSGVFIAVLFGLGMTMWTYGHYPAAYGFVILAGICGFLYWQFSNFLTEKRTRSASLKAKSSAKPRSNPKLAKAIAARSNFILWNITISSLIFLLTFACTVWIYVSELRAEQDDVMQGLTAQMFTPRDSTIFQSGVTITNSGRFDIGKHEIQCAVRRLTEKEGGGINGGGKLEKTLPGDDRLRANGDSETSYCLSAVATPRNDPGTTICADVTVGVLYSLVSQPNNEKKKQFRFVGKYEGTDFIWRGQPVDYPGDYCPAPSLREIEKKSSTKKD